MRRRLLLVAASVAVLIAGGCGIPDDTSVTVVKTGPAEGVPVGGADPAPAQPTRESASSPAQLAENYLQAAAGDSDTALERVKAFMSPELAASFKPTDTDSVRVVREVQTPLYDGKGTVKLSVQQIGTLSSDGVFAPSDSTPETELYELKVDHIADKQGLYVLSAPPVLLMSDTAMRDYYVQRTIYFWNLAYTSLVPDVRYMPKSLPLEQQPTAVLTWLTGGASDWLHNDVASLPSNTTLAENVPAMRDGTLQISLKAPSIQPNDGQTLNRLVSQVLWSLRPQQPTTLELTIGNRDPLSFTNTEYLASNKSYQLADQPERFTIYNGVIRRLKDSPHATEPVPVLKPAANKGISAAAMSASATHTYAAVITGSGAGARLRVGTAALGERGDLKAVGGLSGTLGRPIWATTPDADPGKAIGLITANGQLYSFRANGNAAQRVAWQGTLGKVSAVSVAPDGQRVALVAGGRLYRAMIDYTGDAPGLSSPQLLSPPIFNRVTAVAWSGEAYLAVAGAFGDGRYAVHEVTVDGALQLGSFGLSDIGTTEVTYLTAYPANPTQSVTSASESYEAGGRAWDVVGDPSEVTVDDLAEPTPGAKAGAGTTDPFFLF
ncbi:hypothetical protein HH310_07085 [Actinoplanes sp. TBRC 11911]|uniref:LpqB family beta-propeller domain-containing protein n=1 Tax=Actinoplanes sp. TBRC 11911 TaxID=2729386 RepID=UPI00145D5B23|nr:LpqB family beta-propeller domain-containing protein [Actinoplanes sp. TBRC 11911]NMO50953.1 hypothetical protein [Actinoplanes sp. TBRC 11911]